MTHLCNEVFFCSVARFRSWILENTMEFIILRLLFGESPKLTFITPIGPRCTHVNDGTVQVGYHRWKNELKPFHRGRKVKVILLLH